MHTWIRFTGRLWENLSFEPGVGWETDVVARRPPTGDGTWTLALLDGDGRTVTDVHPLVRFERAPGLLGGRMRVARVVAYLPLHPAGRRVRLCRRDFVIWERALAEAPPTVRISRCAVDEDRTVTLAWDASGRDRLTFRVVYVAEGRGVFPLVAEATGHELRVPLSRLPGSPAGRLAVLASDGLRSAFDVSAPLAVPARPARVAILEPEARAELQWGQPLTLRGVAHDDAGRRLDDSGFVWTLDGQPYARDTALLLATDLRPGPHTLVLAWEGAGAPRAETRGQFTVRAPRRIEGPEPAPEPPPQEPEEVQTTATIRLR